MKTPIKALLLNDTSAEHCGCKLVIDNIIAAAKAHGIDIVGRFTREECKLSSNKFKDAVTNADIVIINGEGTFHRCADAAADLLQISELKFTVLINTLWEKMYDAELLLKKVKFICVRESFSYKEIIKYVDKRKVSIIPDMSFYCKPAIDTTGFCDSVMTTLRASLSQKSNYFGMHPVATSPSLVAYLSWMSSLKLFVTGRFHGVCLAALSNTPFLAFPSNSHKIEGLLADMHCPELLINSFNEIESKKQLYAKKHQSIAAYVHNAPKKINWMFSNIGKLYYAEQS